MAFTTVASQPSDSGASDSGASDSGASGSGAWSLPGPAQPSGPLDDDPPAAAAVAGVIEQVQLLIWDRGGHRELLLRCSMLDAARAIRMLDRYVIAIKEAEHRHPLHGRDDSCPSPKDLAAPPRSRRHPRVVPVLGCGPFTPLPANIVAMMVYYGHLEYDRRRGNCSVDEADSVDAACRAPLVVPALADPPGFVAALAGACAPAGNWAAYGAMQLVVNLFGPGRSDPGWIAVLDASTAFLRRNNVPWFDLPPHVSERFLATGGRPEDWLPFRDPPEPSEVVITPLVVGEIRCVLRAEAATSWSRVLVQACGVDYIAIYEDGTPDPATGEMLLTRRTSSRTPDLHELFISVAWGSPRWTWVHAELLPFLPHPSQMI